jgi:hypothetical protein
MPHLVPGNAERFLDYPRRLYALAVDHAEVVIVESAPAYFHPAFELLPDARVNIPIHVSLLSWFADNAYLLYNNLTEGLLKDKKMVRMTRTKGRTVQPPEAVSASLA